MRVCLLHDIFRAELFGQGGQNHVSRMWEQVLIPVLASLGHQLVRPPAFTMDHPPALRDLATAHGFAALGQKVIEFNLDAVRFCPDLFLRARTDNPATAAPTPEGSHIDGDFATLLLTPGARRLRLTARAETPLTLDISIRPTGQSRTIRLDPAHHTEIDPDLPQRAPLEFTLRPSARVTLTKIQGLPAPSTKNP